MSPLSRLCIQVNPRKSVATCSKQLAKRVWGWLKILTEASNVSPRPRQGASGARPGLRGFVLRGSVPQAADAAAGEGELAQDLEALSKWLAPSYLDPKQLQAQRLSAAPLGRFSERISLWAPRGVGVWCQETNGWLHVPWGIFASACTACLILWLKVALRLRRAISGDVRRRARATRIECPVARQAQTALSLLVALVAK